MTLQNEQHEQLRQLAHDIKTHLGIVTMGLHALEAVRESPAEFVEMRKTIEDDGISQLKELVAKLVDLACAEQDAL